MFANCPNMNCCETPVYMRLSSIARCIERYRRGKSASLVLPLWNLRVIHDEFRFAGHKEVPQFCSRAESLLFDLENKYGEEASAQILMIYDLLNCICEHTVGGLLPRNTPLHESDAAGCSAVNA